MRFICKIDNSTCTHKIYALLQEEDSFFVKTFTNWQRTNSVQSRGGFSRRQELVGDNREAVIVHPKYPDCTDIWGEFELAENGAITELRLD